MKRSLWILAGALLVLGVAGADEGMWMPSQIPSLGAELKAMGMELDPAQLADLHALPIWDGRLARCYSHRGNPRTVRLYDDLAAFHWNASGPNSPKAKAAVMPSPARPTFTRVVAHYPDHPDDAA